MNASSKSESNPPSFIPLFIDGLTLRCLVIGGGNIACRKVRQLASAGATITLIAEEINVEIQELVDQDKVIWFQRAFRSGDVAGFHLVIAATDDKAVNHRVSIEAQEKKILVNVVDDPEFCTALFPAVWRDGDLICAVGTGGQAPFMSAHIRNLLRDTGTGWGEWIHLAGEFRALVRKQICNDSDRNELYERFIELGPRVGVISLDSTVDPEVWLKAYQKLEHPHSENIPESDDR